jgi:hypothetical protein
MNDKSEDGLIINKLQFKKIRKVAQQFVLFPTEKKDFLQFIQLGKGLTKILSCPRVEDGQPIPISITNPNTSNNMERLAKIKPRATTLDQKCNYSKTAVIRSESAEVVVEGGELFKNVVKVKGWGPYESMMVYSIDAPGVKEEDITFNKSGGVWQVFLNREPHTKLAMPAEKKMTREMRQRKPDYEKDTIKDLVGFAWPVQAGEQGNTIHERDYTQKAILLQHFKKVDFNWKIRPNLRCLYEMKLNKGLDWNNKRQNNINKPPLNRCKPYSLHNGILYIYAGVKAAKQQGTDEKDPGLSPRRRRAVESY